MERYEVLINGRVDKTFSDKLDAVRQLNTIIARCRASTRVKTMTIIDGAWLISFRSGLRAWIEIQKVTS